MGWGCMAAIPAKMERSWSWREEGTWPKRRSSCIFWGVGGGNWNENMNEMF